MHFRQPASKPYPGPFLEETHYYPFGLTMFGIFSKAAGGIENKRKFNEGSELENKEFSNGSGLELYATNYRSLDPQIGRFWQIDPFAEASESWASYTYANCNPILFNDPYGLTADSTVKPTPPPCSDCPTGKLAEVKDLKEVVVTANIPASNSNDNNYNWYKFFNDHNPGGDFLYQLNKWNPLANVANGIWTYVTGHDSYGVEQSITEGTVQIASVIPITRISSTVTNVSLAAIRQGLAKTLANPNNLSHILASKHNLNLLVSKAGSESNVIRHLYLSLGQSGGVPANGNFEVSVKIYGYDVIIRGAVVDGIPRIGTVYIK
jgi:RHS repeat-associated protein